LHRAKNRSPKSADGRVATEAAWLKWEQTWKEGAKVCLEINRLQLHKPEVEDQVKIRFGKEHEEATY
jgi:hypothetical protein